MFWSIIDQSGTPPPPRSLHLCQKGHRALVLSADSGTPRLPSGTLMSHYSSSPIERRRGDGRTHQDLQRQLPRQPARPLVPSAASQGRFQLNSASVWDILIPPHPARLSRRPHLWSPDSGRVNPWIKPSLCSLCVLVFYMEIRGAVWMGLASSYLFGCHIERPCHSMKPELYFIFYKKGFQRTWSKPCHHHPDTGSKN